MDIAHATRRGGAGSSRRAVIAPSGELDERTAGGLRARAEELITQGRPDLVLDLSGVTFCDVCGLSALIGIRRRALEAGGSLLLASVPAVLDKLLERTGLDSVLTAHPTLDDALASGRGTG